MTKAMEITPEEMEELRQRISLLEEKNTKEANLA